ncbi:30S ribosomal protein S5 [Hippea jasoniae]|uniref:30S ribosomal protein S5 n=1 Tax=Hippea jasoniae TaxID=944479 RepID=UPI000552C84C|nr:30S ribosomal protein S5 [Hippea jasoniae]
MAVEKEFEEQVITIKRVTKVVKGGRRFRFSALVAVGDKNGRVGLGLGKSHEVPEAIKKAIEKAKKNLITVPITEDGTIPHQLEVKEGAGRVLIKPARPGTGIIAGNTARAILEVCGIRNIVTKSIGSNNVYNLSHALLKALSLLRDKDEIFKVRGLK